MESNMGKENGLRINSTPVRITTKANISMIKRMGMVFLSGRVVICIKEIIKKI